MSIGSLGVALVAGLTPYNDYVVANSWLIGNHLPLAILLTIFLMVVLINAPLHALAPGRALGSGEMGIVLAMMLVGCAFPTTGLLRTWLPMLVAPAHLGARDPLFWSHFIEADFPGWMFAVPLDAAGRNDRVMWAFFGRLLEGESLPWRAWAVPLAGWGVFIGAWIAALLALSAMLRRQWIVNERLPFPIAQLQIALIAPPEKGRMLNGVFRSRAFWIALTLIFFLHSLNALHGYLPAHVPRIPLQYDLSRILSEEPFSHLRSTIKRATLYFTLIGLTYFIQSRVAFSLWGTFWAIELIDTPRRMMNAGVPSGAWADQQLGAGVAFAIGVLWIGRRHWLKILRHTFQGRDADEARRGDESYRKWLVTFLIAIAVMAAWLITAGAQLWVAAFIIAFILLSHLVISRVVAETGLPFIRFTASPSQLYGVVPAGAMGTRDVFLVSGFAETMGPVSTREGLLAFATHGMKIIDAGDRPPRATPVIALMAWAAALSLAVSVASSLLCYYHHAFPISTMATAEVVNVEGLEGHPQRNILTPMRRHAEGRWPPTQHSPPLHFGIGMITTGLLQIASLRWNWWPFMPIGYLTSSIWYIHVAWWSIFLGWLAKLAVLKYGGARLYQDARPFFIGMIFGEGLAAGAWLLINLALSQLGVDYQTMAIHPG